MTGGPLTGEILVTRKPTKRNGGPVTGEILVTPKPAKRSGGVSISPGNVALFGITALVKMVMNKLSF